MYTFWLLTLALLALAFALLTLQDKPSTKESFTNQEQKILDQMVLDGVLTKDAVYMQKVAALRFV